MSSPTSGPVQLAGHDDSVFGVVPNRGTRVRWRGTPHGRLSLPVAAVLAAGLFVSPAASDPVPLAPPAILSGPADPTNLTSASFAFSGSETETFECSLDGAAFVPCASPQTYSAPELEEGSRRFEVRAVAVDSQSEPASYTWYIDLMPPQLPENVSAEASSARGAVVVFTPTDDRELASGECEPASGSVFALGTTTVTCTAADAAGNSVAGEFDVTVEDTTPPSIPQHPDQVAEQDFSGGARVTYDPEITAQDAVDPTPTILCDPVSGSEFPLEPVPSSTVSCAAIDDSGNQSALMQFTVTVLRGPVPEAPVIAVKPPAVTNATTAHFEFSTKEGISSVGCRLYAPNNPGAPFEDCLGSRDYTGLAEGSHLFQVRVVNGIGNLNESSYGWTVDLTKPMTVTNFRTRARPGVVTLTWVPSIDEDVDRVRIQRQRVGTATWKTIAESDAATYTDRALANDVQYRYGIVSVDAAGNVSDPAFATGRPSRLLTPQYNASLRPPVQVDWISVKKATYYNLQVWRNGRKVLSVWPSRSRYRLPASWKFKGKRYSISRQRHIVYVWPGFGPKAAVVYGRLVGSTSFSGA